MWIKKVPEKAGQKRVFYIYPYRFFSLTLKYKYQFEFDDGFKRKQDYLFFK